MLKWGNLGLFDFCVLWLLTEQKWGANHLVNIMMVKNVVKVLVDIIQHIYHLHRGAVFAECGEANNVTEVDSDFFK